LAQANFAQAFGGEWSLASLGLKLMGNGREGKGSGGAAASKGGKSGKAGGKEQKAGKSSGQVWESAAPKDKGKDAGAGKQPLEAKGSHCEVKKHSEMGCAVVTMESAAARELVLKHIAPKQVAGDEGKKGERREITIGDHTAQMRVHIDKEKKEEVKTDLFIAWGHKSEKASPLAATTIVEAFDRLYCEAAASVQQQQQAWPGAPHVPVAMPMMQTGHMAMMSPQAMTAMSQAQGQACMQQQQQYAYMLALQQQQAMQHHAATAATAGTMAQQVAAMAMVQQQHQQMQHQQQHAEANAGQQQQHLATAEGGATPAPCTPPSGDRHGSGMEMRADAQPFVYSAQSQVGQAGAYSEYSSYDLCGSYMHSGSASQPERKPLNIVDPRSGQQIEVPPIKDAQPGTPTKPQGPKRMAILNPKTNERVDAVALNFKKAGQDRKAFAIINPNDKTIVQAN